MKSDLEIGDEVLLRQEKTDKLSTNFNPELCKVVEVEQGQVTVRNKQGLDVTLSTEHTKRYNEQIQPQCENLEAEAPNSREITERLKGSGLPTLGGPSFSESDSTPGLSRDDTGILTRPKRNVNRPSRFKDFV